MANDLTSSRSPTSRSNFPRAILFYAKGIWGFVSLLDIESIFQKIQFLAPHNVSPQNTGRVIFPENPLNIIVCKIIMHLRFLRTAM